MLPAAMRLPQLDAETNVTVSPGVLFPHTTRGHGDGANAMSIKGLGLLEPNDRLSCSQK